MGQRIRGGVQRVARAVRGGNDAPLNEATVEERHIATRDAGWVQVLDVDIRTERGRGQLMMWGEQLHPGSTIEARLTSYTATGAPLEAGNDVVLMSEQAQEHYPAHVRAIEEGGVVVLDWPMDDAPSPLTEVGGE